MTKDEIIKYQLINEKARYEAIKAISVAFKHIVITLLLCITLIACAYMYFVVPAEEAKDYVRHFVNKDGTTGAHWTMEQTKSYQATHEEVEDLNPICFYVAMNMMYSDYYQPERKTDTYAILAKDFLEDEDAPKDKLKRYLKAMHS